MVAIDANLIAHTDPKDIEMAKRAELIAAIFSSHGIGVVMFDDNAFKRHDIKIEKGRRRCVNKIMKVSLVKK